MGGTRWCSVKPVLIGAEKHSILVPRMLYCHLLFIDYILFYIWSILFVYFLCSSSSIFISYYIYIFSMAKISKRQYFEERGDQEREREEEEGRGGSSAPRAGEGVKIRSRRRKLRQLPWQQMPLSCQLFISRFFNM